MNYDIIQLVESFFVAMDNSGNQKTSLFTLDKSRSTFKNLFFITVIVFLFLPFWTTFQDILTRFVMSVRWYKYLQDYIVPYEIRTVHTLLSLLGLSNQAGTSFLQWHTHTGQTEVIYIIWNCVGWQTIILFVITLFTGLAGRYTLGSKFETFLIGLLGTYLINILRITLVIIVYMFFGRLFGTVFHDYFSSILSIFWLVLFWWISYRYVLIEKEVKQISVN